VLTAEFARYRKLLVNDSNHSMPLSMTGSYLDGFRSYSSATHNATSQHFVQQLISPTTRCKHYTSCAAKTKPSPGSKHDRPHCAPRSASQPGIARQRVLNARERRQQRRLLEPVRLVLVHERARGCHAVPGLLHAAHGRYACLLVAWRDAWRVAWKVLSGFPAGCMAGRMRFGSSTFPIRHAKSTSLRLQHHISTAPPPSPKRT